MLDEADLECAVRLVLPDTVEDEHAPRTSVATQLASMSRSSRGSVNPPACSRLCPSKRYSVGSAMFTSNIRRRVLRPRRDRQHAARAAAQLAPESGAELWVKLEYLNPSGSMKDRMALAMIEGAERDGLLEPGTTVVEYTGGSTGPALALVCRAKGYRARIVISDCFSDERIQLMRALGADVDVIPAVEARATSRPRTSGA